MSSFNTERVLVDQLASDLKEKFVCLLIFPECHL